MSKKIVSTVVSDDAAMSKAVVLLTSNGFQVTIRDYLGPGLKPTAAPAPPLPPPAPARTPAPLRTRERPAQFVGWSQPKTATPSPRRTQKEMRVGRRSITDALSLKVLRLLAQRPSGVLVRELTEPCAPELRVLGRTDRSQYISGLLWRLVVKGFVEKRESSESPLGLMVPNLYLITDIGYLHIEEKEAEERARRGV